MRLVGAMLALSLWVDPALAVTISGNVVYDQNRPLANFAVAAYPVSIENCCGTPRVVFTDAAGNLRGELLLSEARPARRRAAR